MLFGRSGTCTAAASEPPTIDVAAIVMTSHRKGTTAHSMSLWPGVTSPRSASDASHT
jgi:hypothetical protein